jgi:magnesium transporter
MPARWFEKSSVPDQRTLPPTEGAFPVAGPTDTAGAVRSSMLGRSFGFAGQIAVLEDQKLLGLIAIETLLAADPDTRLDELMDTDPAVVSSSAGNEAGAWAIARTGRSGVAVVDERGRLLTLVPPHRTIRALLAEHDEDIARLGGYLASTKRARQAAEEPVGRRLWHRLPWLLVGLAGAMASAALVGAFESQLKENILLAVFVPAVVYMADAVGTQTEAVVIRGLSVGVSIRQVLRREVATGVAIGLAIAFAFLPFAWGVWGDQSVAVAVSAALLGSCSIASVVALLLPWLLDRLGMDPAFGSGPLATVLQDLLSLAVYFAVAIPIVGP